MLDNAIDDVAKGDIFGLIYQIRTLQSWWEEREMGKVGLTPEKVTLLDLCAHGGSTASMSRALCRRPQSLTGAIDRLVRDGLVKRDPKIKLTKKGKAELGKGLHVQARLNDDRADALKCMYDVDKSHEGALRDLRDTMAKFARIDIL